MDSSNNIVISWDVDPFISPLRQYPLKYILKAIFNPRCWMGRAVGYDKNWTETLFYLIRDASSIKVRYIEVIDWVNTYSITVDETHKVWVANHPYASFTLYEDLKPDSHNLPKRWVALYLEDVLRDKWHLSMVGDRGVIDTSVDGRATGAT